MHRHRATHNRGAAGCGRSPLTRGGSSTMDPHRPSRTVAPGVSRAPRRARGPLLCVARSPGKNFPGGLVILRGRGHTNPMSTPATHRHRNMTRNERVAANAARVAAVRFTPTERAEHRARMIAATPTTGRRVAR